MRNKTVGSFSLIKQINTTLILRMIHECGLISRAEIAKETGLTPATVSNLTAELIDRGLILEVNEGVSTGGRKPIMLGINPDDNIIAAVYIGAVTVDVALTNLTGDIIQSVTLPFKKDASPDVVIAGIVEHLLNVKNKILGVGVSLHGPVNTIQGILKFSPYRKWKDVAVLEMLSKDLPYPVYIDNDARITALAEYWYGSAKAVNNFAYMHIGTGVGGSYMIDGELQHGSADFTGEIGHTTIEASSDAVCSCGNLGCLEALASYDKLLLELGLDLTPKDLFELYENGDEKVTKALEKHARYIGIGASNFINIVDPSMLIIGGVVCSFGDSYMDIIKNEVENRCIRFNREAVKIVFSSLENAMVKGATALVISEIFKSMNVSTKAGDGFESNDEIT